MINTSFSGKSPIYQVNNSWNLPSNTGAVQWNGGLKRFEVSNGGSWSPIDNSVFFQTSLDFEAVFNWAKDKMDEEAKLKDLLMKYPALKDAKEKYDIIYTLVTSGEK